MLDHVEPARPQIKRNDRRAKHLALDLDIRVVGLHREAFLVCALTRDQHGDLRQMEAQARGIPVSEARRLKALEEDNRPLKKVVAGLALDNEA